MKDGFACDRRSVRMPGWDYRQPGAYFVTICVDQHKPLLGRVVQNVIHLSEYGRLTETAWREIPFHFGHVSLDAHVVMPNHIHGILFLEPSEGTACRAPTEDPNSTVFGVPVSGALSTIVRSYKAETTRRVNQLRASPGAALWQRGYYEHVIRSEKALLAVQEYIVANPANWTKDEDYVNG